MISPVPSILLYLGSTVTIPLLLSLSLDSQPVSGDKSAHSTLVKSGHCRAFPSTRSRCSPSTWRLRCWRSLAASIIAHLVFSGAVTQTYAALLFRTGLWHLFYDALKSFGEPSHCCSRVAEVYIHWASPLCCMHGHTYPNDPKNILYLKTNLFTTDPVIDVRRCFLLFT